MEFSLVLLSVNEEYEILLEAEEDELINLDEENPP